MRILVLGGSGFIGSHLSELLVELGHEVVVFHQAGASVNNLLAIVHELEIIEGDFNNTLALEKAVKNAEVVVHLVSATLPGNSMLNPTYDVQMNVISSIQLFDQCVKAGVRKVVFISSGGTVYGIPQQDIINESHPLNPISPYGISKLTIEKYLAMHHYHFGLDYTVLRLSNPYGPRQDSLRGQGVIAAWMKKISEKQPIEIWGDGMVVRDYLYIADAVNAIHLAITKQSESKVLNVGSGIGCSLLDLHRLLEKQLEQDIRINFREMQKVDVPVNVLDISLISESLGWYPLVDIAEGLRRFWDSRSHSLCNLSEK